MNLNARKNYGDASASADRLNSNGTILLVDDEPIVRAMTAAVLTAMGWNVLNVSSGEDAIVILQNTRRNGTPVDMVILDLILPCGMGGIAAAAQLRKIQPDIRILACSGFFSDDGGESCLGMGFNGRLAKPFTAEDLSQAVYNCANGLEPAPSQAQMAGA